MSTSSPLPDAAVLEQLLLGQLPPDEAEALCAQLQDNEQFAALAQTLLASDTLIETLRAQTRRPTPRPNARLEGLMARLCQLRPDLSGADSERTAALDAGSVAAPLIFLSPPQQADEMGRLGDYRVLKVLGQGGMGMVYLAEDVRLKRKVALKVMKPELAANQGARQRFLREAESSAAVRSDHVITIYQVGEQGNAPFLAMECLEGMSLDDWLKKGRKPTLAQAARMGRQIALGLAAAHERGLMHRDIKPGNIWLESNHQGRVKLLDFGLARGTADEVHLTQSGAIVGTPAYMAPEQARGDHVDHRCDLFSLGVVLYRLTTSQLPFRGDNTMSILTSLAMDKPRPPREVNADIPPRLAELIERLLSKDREQRPATAKAVADELANIEREATQPGPDERTLQTLQAASAGERSLSPAPSRSRLRWLIAASLLFLFGGLAAGIVVIIRDKDGNKVAEINLPKSGTVEIKDADKGEANRQRQLPGDKIDPAPLPPPLRNQPFSPVVLVQHPAKLPGVRSWSIESRNIFNAAAMAYRPDGKRLAVACSGGIIRVWDPESGRLVQVLLESSTVGSMVWSPDGRVLALGCEGKQPVRLFEAETGRLIRALEAPVPNEGSALAWSEDGSKVRAKMHSSTECHTWNASDGKLLGTVQIPCIGSVFSPNGKQLAGQRSDGRPGVWDAETGKEVGAMTGYKGTAS
jgi:serine/threonine protein kinase